MFVMTFYVLACGGIINALVRLTGHGRWIAAGFCTALLVTAVSVFHWTYWYWAPTSHLEAVRRHEVLRQLVDYFETHVDENEGQTIVLPLLSQFVNAETLKFELQKRRLWNVTIISYFFSVADARRARDGRLTLLCSTRRSGFAEYFSRFAFL